jgi:hypothetical protein
LAVPGTVKVAAFARSGFRATVANANPATATENLPIAVWMSVHLLLVFFEMGYMDFCGYFG